MPSLRLILVYLGLALVLVQLHGDRVNHGPREAKRLDRHQRILTGTGDAPWGYRIGTPWVVEAGRRVVDGPLPDPLPKARSAERRALSVDLERGYLAVRFGAIAGFLVLFHTWLRRFVDDREATAGTLLAAALHAPSFNHYWFQPASAVDLLIWTAGLVALDRRRDAWLVPLVLIGAVNRETAVFLVLFYGAMRWGQLPLTTLVARMAGLGVLWAVPVFAIRSWIGPLGWAGRGSTPLDYLTANLTNPHWMLYAASFLGVLWLMPVLAWHRSPRELRALVLVFVPYVGLQFLFGRIREVRLFLPLVLVLVPMLLLWLRADEPDAPDGVSEAPGPAR